MKSRLRPGIHIMAVSYSESGQQEDEHRNARSMPFVLCLFYRVSFFCFIPIINTRSSYPKVRLIYEIIVKKLRLFQKLAVYLSRILRIWPSFIKTSLQAEERYGLTNYVSPGLTMASTRVSNPAVSSESRRVCICFLKNWLLR